VSAAEHEQAVAAAVEAVLTEHGAKAQPYALVCKCGSQWMYQSMLGRAEDRHRDHVSTAIAAALAAAGLTASQDRAAVERVRALADEWHRIGRDGLPHLGCLDMYRHCAAELRAALATPQAEAVERLPAGAPWPREECGNRGPRIGEDGTRCRRSKGHVGHHRTAPSDGFGHVEWSNLTPQAEAPGSGS
jgi:hypothetical protein